jgi:hypothetical protein
MSLSGDEHRQRCRDIARALQLGLDQKCRLGDTSEIRRDRHLFLASVLQNMTAGTKGAGLSGGVAQENLWREMLADMQNGFSDKPKNTQATAEADYYFNDYPLSHKTIGYKSGGGAALALAWSKNPPGGLQRTEFTSSMLILNYKPQPVGKLIKDANWRRAKQGAHIIPLPDLQNIVKKFGSNNKTDSLIESKYVGQLITFSQDNGYSVYFDFDYNAGKDYVLSYWRHGIRGAVKRL